MFVQNIAHVIFFQKGLFIYIFFNFLKTLKQRIHSKWQIDQFLSQPERICMKCVWLIIMIHLRIRIYKVLFEWFEIDYIVEVNVLSLCSSLSNQNKN